MEPGNFSAILPTLEMEKFTFFIHCCKQGGIGAECFSKIVDQYIFCLAFGKEPDPLIRYDLSKKAPPLD